MRYFRTIGRNQVRMGWLSVGAVLVANDRCDQDTLRKTILHAATARSHGVEAQLRWLRRAKIDAAPLGTVSPDSAANVTGMASIYGIFNPDAQALTDLGQVLVATEGWRPGNQVSPFAWEGEKRFIGLRLLIGADGDVQLALLRQWPESGVLPGKSESVGFIADVLTELAEGTASEEDRHALFRQAASADREADRAWRSSVFPRLEPLRDLGYVQSTGVAAGYQLTERGLKLRDLLRGETVDAERLLVAGLPQLYIRAEGIDRLVAGTAEDLRQTLVRLPLALLGAMTEAPIEPVVLLTQFRLLAERPGAWIDLEYARELLSKVEKRSNGRIALKADTTVFVSNVTWQAGEDLSSEALWDLSAPGTSDGTETPTVLPPNPPGLSGNELLWLQFLSRLLRPGFLGGVAGVRYGGPWSWIAALHRGLGAPAEALKKRREASRDPSDQERTSSSTRHLARWLRVVEGSGPLDPLRFKLERGKSHWNKADDHDIDLLGAILDRASDEAECSLPAVASAIRFRLSGPAIGGNRKAWEALAELTRGLIEDLVHKGYWRRDELLAHVLTLVSKDPKATSTLLDSLVPTSGSDDPEYLFSLDFEVDRSVLDAVVELGKEDCVLEADGSRAEISQTSAPNDSGAPWVNVTVTLRGRTPTQATFRGREYANEALARLLFIAACRAGEQARSYGSSTARLSRDGDVVNVDDSCPDSVATLVEPDDFGFLEGPSPMGPVRSAVASLPSLARVDRGRSIDCRSRLSRAVHWLAASSAQDARPIEKLSSAWVALEHLAAEGKSQKLESVIRCVPPVVVIHHVRARLGRVYREALTGLHVAACGRPSDTALQECMTVWLGSEDREKYAARQAGPPCHRNVIAGAHLSLTEEDAVRQLLARTPGELAALADAIRDASPLAAWLLDSHRDRVGDGTKFAKWIADTRGDCVSFLQHAYELRNQLVHDADPFGFDEAYRLQDLHLRFREMTDAVVSDVLRRAGPGPEFRPLPELWASYSVRIEELIDAARAGKDKPVDTAVVLALLFE